MRAVGLHETGGPEVLTLIDVPEPEPGPGEVRIKVAAAGVNPTDVGLRSSPQMAPQDVDPPWIPGMDAAGIVDAVGEGVYLAPGDRVAAVVNPRRPQGGAYVEKLVVPAVSVVRIPDTMELEEASTLLMNGLTAHFTLQSLNLGPDDVVGVTGAAGTLGSYVIGLATHAGHPVVADAKQSDVDLVRSYGADTVVERGERFAAAVREVAPNGVDGLVDCAVLDLDVLPAVKDGGHVATVRGFDNGGEPAERDVRFIPVLVRNHLDDTRTMEELVARAVDGTLQLRVAKTFPAEEAAEAHRMLEGGGVRGRVVLTF